MQSAKTEPRSWREQWSHSSRHAANSRPFRDFRSDRDKLSGRGRRLTIASQRSLFALRCPDRVSASTSVSPSCVSIVVVHAARVHLGASNARNSSSEAEGFLTNPFFCPSIFLPLCLLRRQFGRKIEWQKNDMHPQDDPARSRNRLGTTTSTSCVEQKRRTASLPKAELHHDVRSH